MAEIEVRPAIASDLHALVEIDHSYHTDHVWQMEIESEEGQTQVTFREIRLPRSMRVDYPRDVQRLPDEWKKNAALFVAEEDEGVVGYIRLALNVVPETAWVTDLAVMRRLRRRGVGTALVMGAQVWAAQQAFQSLLLEFQSKNYPAVRLASKLGFEFCGYSDHYYPNQDIALFFTKRLQ